MNQNRPIAQYSALKSAISDAEHKRSIEPASEHDVLLALGQFSVAFDIYDDEDLQAKFALLVRSVEGEPLWAVKQGVDDFSLGRVKRKRHGMPLASEFGPHVAEMTSWAREQAKAERQATEQNRFHQYPPADGDGISFNMTPAELKAAGKWVAARFEASGLKETHGINAFRVFFRSMRWQETKRWLDEYRAGNRGEEAEVSAPINEMSSPAHVDRFAEFRRPVPGNTKSLPLTAEDVKDIPDAPMRDGNGGFRRLPVPDFNPLPSNDGRAA